MGKLVDLTGEKFGKLTVIRREGSKSGKALWLCRCECGKEVIIRGDSLRGGHTKSCGLVCCGGSKFIDITNQVFGKLIVIEKVGRQGSHIYWRCRCTCGLETLVTGDNLRNGHIKSCGSDLCKGQLIDLTNQTFSQLTVLKRAGTKETYATWHCRCSCGKEVIIRGDRLRSGETKSCGCIKSYAELQITSFLLDWQVSFQQEQTFPDLISNKGYPLRFDFAFYNQQNELLGLLEYHGDQHYDENSNWHTPEGEIRDDQKQVFAREKGIPIITLNKHSNLEADLRDFLVSIGALTT